MTQSPTKPIALVTGASSGIGATYAAKLAARGYDLVLVARRADRLQALAQNLASAHGTQSEIIIADLTTEAGIASVEAVLAGNAGIEMLVNNAGISRIGYTKDISTRDVSDLLAVNITALTRLTHAAVPAFLSRNRGTIINIASALSFGSLPVTSLYSGTKGFVLNFSRGVQLELEGTGVRLQVVLPAGVATEIYDGSIIPLDSIPPEFVMTVENLVDAALTGLDSGEIVTLPSVADTAVWDQYDSARLALFNATQSGTPAPRYTRG